MKCSFLDWHLASLIIGEMNSTAGTTISYGFMFAGVSALVIHTILYHGEAFSLSLSKRYDRVERWARTRIDERLLCRSINCGTIPFGFGGRKQGCSCKTNVLLSGSLGLVVRICLRRRLSTQDIAACLKRRLFRYYLLFCASFAIGMVHFHYVELIPAYMFLGRVARFSPLNLCRESLFRCDHSDNHSDSTEWYHRCNDKYVLEWVQFFHGSFFSRYFEIQLTAFWHFSSQHGSGRSVK